MASLRRASTARTVFPVRRIRRDISNGWRLPVRPLANVPHSWFQHFTRPRNRDLKASKLTILGFSHMLRLTGFAKRFALLDAAHKHPAQQISDQYIPR